MEKTAYYGGGSCHVVIGLQVFEVGKNLQFFKILLAKSSLESSSSNG